MNAPHRHRLATAVSLCLIAAAPGLAVAQDAPQPSSATTLDTVQVTGTRIMPAEIERQTPVQTLSREDLERTGLTSVGDILQ